MKEVLGFINDVLTSLGVPYEFLEWTQPVRYPYFTGEYSETEPTTESGECDKYFMLTGFARGKDALMELEDIREKLEKAFPEREGRIATLNSGSVVAIFYSNALHIPSGEAELHKIQVNLFIKLWKVV